MARTSRRPGKCRWASHPRSPGAGCCTARDSQRARVFGRMRVGRSSGDPSSVDPPAGTRWNRRTVRAIHGRRAGDVSGSSSSAPDRSGSRLFGIGRMGAGTVAPRARRVGCRIVLWSHRAHGCQPLPAHRRGRPLRDIRRAPALPMVRGSSRFVPTRRPPTLVLALLLTGGDRGLARAVRQALDRVPARLVSSRIQNAVRVDARVELERLSQPLLWLHAKQDRLIRFPSAEAIRALRPAARVVEVDGPHLLLQANPAEAWRHIAPFLESASNGRAQVRR